jgi:hypothetical protein
MMLRTVLNIRIIFVVFFLITLVSGEVIAEAEKSTIVRSLDVLALQGSWVRTDSPYVIELHHSQDGSLQASYFNPKPINVGKTETAEQGGMVQIMIELQDVNYPGSTYVLSYDRSQDLLEGIYFHPVSKKSYPVSFVRKPTSQ